MIPVDARETLPTTGIALCEDQLQASVVAVDRLPVERRDVCRAIAGVTQDVFRVIDIDFAVAVIILQSDLPALRLEAGERREWRLRPLPVLTGRQVEWLQRNEVLTPLVDCGSFNCIVATELTL